MTATWAAGPYDDVDLSALPTAEWELVTPTMAGEALKHMRRQRPLKEGKCQGIVEDILNGRWRNTGETVQQGGDGLWDNGLHRFTAVVRAGVAVPMLVVRGIPEDARLVIDSGSTRSYPDTLQMRGVVNATIVGAITRRMWLWDTRHSYVHTGGGKLTPTTQMLDAYRAEFFQEITDAAAMKDAAKGCWLSPTVLGTIYILLRRVNADDAKVFLDGLTTGASLARDDPRYQVRAKLRSLYERGTDDADVTRAWVFVAWNLWRDGKRVTRLQPPRGGTARQPFTDKNYPLPR